ncbi:CLC6A-like protein [Mya arenaria]|uniref:CLC6A-like protein n=1 Tax=Mya arenaria TaxID=6604 RepID=A0ABY7E3B3_MYAAR|nr:CLC6A-like protein [Mya arenaria]
MIPRKVLIFLHGLNNFDAVYEARYIQRQREHPPKQSHPTPHVLSSCPNGWIAYEGSCYLFNNKDNMSFVAAEEFCTQNGGHVVHIDDEAENNFIKDQARQYTHTSNWDPSQPNDGSYAECVVLWADQDYKWDI